MKAKDQRLKELREKIHEIEPDEALALQKEGAVLLDVREMDEVAQGSPEGSVRITRGFLELRVEDAIPEKDRKIMTLCAGGVRSLFAAEALQTLGYTDVHSITGGFSRWKNKGLPFEVPRMLDDDARERYARHLVMPDVGEEGQLKLLDAKVLLIGTGGLGSPSALYLAAAGVGTIGLVDHDVVDRSNLQRQITHTEDSIGVPKVESARARIHALNPRINVNVHETYLNSDNVDELFSGYDIIVDGSDNLATRYLVSDACVKHGLPNIHAAVYQFEGQITVFWPGYEKHQGPCYRCLFPEPPSADAAPSCAQAGVLGVLPGVMGLLQAVETIKIILGIGEPLVGKMLYYNALYTQFHELKIARKPDCKICGDHGNPQGDYEDYEQVCASETN
ncbi:MAG: molybdopterin-synthase adenylyltransferase MoeB [Gammaproteobacteria bacterium]|nr:MAG: molybdopterin-synthase adenylyltransferase MoeB [Gammaproteobacteria bacterium]